MSVRPESSLLQAEAERMGQLIVELLSDVDMPQNVSDDPNLAAVWLADRMIDVAKINRGRVAADAELAQNRIADISSAMGEPNSSNARRKAPEWAQIRDAQRAADLAQVNVPVRIRGLTYTASPRMG